MEKNLIDLLEDPGKQKILFYSILLFNLIVAVILVISPVTSIKGAEPNVIYTIQMTMLNKTWMYQDPESIPFSATQYTPLYYVVCSIFGNLLSLTPGDDVVPIYQISRLVSFINCVGVSCFIFLILHKVHDVNKPWSWWIALLSVLCATPWYYAVRPDSLMSLFLFASIFCFGGYQRNWKHPYRYLFLAGALAALSFFSKQNGLIVSLVIGSYLLFTARLKELGIFITGVATGSLLFCLVFYPFYTKFFFQHLFQGLNNGINIQDAIGTAYYGFISRFGTISLLTFLLIFILHSQVSFKNLSDEIKFMIYLLIITFLFAIVTALKIGSDINYFNEAIAISFILLCKVCWIIKDRNQELNSRWFKIFAFCLTFSFALSISMSGFLMVGIRNIKRMNERSDVYNNEVISFVKEAQNKTHKKFYMIADDAFIINSFPSENILPHTDIASLWYTRNIYDYSRLKTAIAEGGILLYIGEGYKLTIFNIDLENNFSLIKTIQGYKIYQNNNVTTADLSNKK
jgi:hypothetical protein